MQYGLRKMILAGVALGLGAADAAAQDMQPEDLLAQSAQQANSEVEQEPVPQSMEEAFPRMVSDPVVQGEYGAEVVPLIQEWTPEQASALALIIRDIGKEGLDPVDYRLSELMAQIGHGASDRLSEVASQAFVWLIEDLRDGRTTMDARQQWFVIDPDRDLFRSGELMREALGTGDIAGVIERIKPTHPDYARLRDALAATPEEDIETRQLIRANMDRWRWLARDLGDQYLITNVPEYQLRLTVKDKIISSYRTIVGKPGRTATPQLAEIVEGVVFNPTWTVPQSIVVGEGLGNKVLNNPAWARAQGYTRTEHDGWVSVVQQPGPANSLGRMKIHMPNEHAIFLHDTPSRHLFADEMRALSHGCIRTERALELAITMAILGRGVTKEEAVEIATSGKYKLVPVQRRLPVYITYFTMATDIDGELKEFDDIYGRDAPVLASLAKPRKADKSRTFEQEIIVIEDNLQDAP
ncbi:L,D-transpeptidase-like protein [Altererythrobacter ishigakiensis]|uniref:L,D-transpeptidase-like protein n=2 Tax=Altererythrobacter ishigakiensis TaxID=476157 RepID=A0A562UUB6_9SPHN|nr:L,D-transpeptidase-like protein [Altererythrobacter ishigakiensis]